MVYGRDWRVGKVFYEEKSREGVRKLLGNPRRERASRLDFSNVLAMKRSLVLLNSFINGFGHFSNGRLSDLATNKLDLLGQAVQTAMFKDTLVLWIQEQEEKGTTVAEAIKFLATNLPQEVAT